VQPLPKVAQGELRGCSVCDAQARRLLLEHAARHPSGLAQSPDAHVTPVSLMRRMQVPYTITDEDLSDTWECTGNVWDPGHASCDVPQELSNQAIDEILALQVGVPQYAALFMQMSIRCLP